MYTCVAQAFDLQDLREVAVKLHQLSSSWSDVKKASYVKHAVREYKIHRQLRSATTPHWPVDSGPHMHPDMAHTLWLLHVLPCAFVEECSVHDAQATSAAAMLWISPIQHAHLAFWTAAPQECLTYCISPYWTC